MQTIFIGFVEDDVSLIQKGIAIRMAYLLSARFRIAGTISSYYTLSQDLRNVSFEQKIKFVDETMKKEGEREQLYPQYKDFQKVYKRYGGNQKEFIVAKKKMELHVNGMFNIILDNFGRAIEDAGLTDLKPIQDSSSYAEYYIPYQHSENETNQCNKLSEILLLDLEEEDNKNHTVFVLSGLFFSPEFNETENNIPALNVFSEKGFLQELFTFPNCNDFSVADLNTLRFELKESLEHFQIAVKAFADLQLNPANAFNYLQNIVLIAANTLTAHINKTDILVSYKKIKSATLNAGKLYLGMVPQHLVFKYFQFVKASQQETIEILNQIPEDELNKFVPVLITVFNEDTVDEETTAVTQTQSMPLKKSLSID